MKQSDVDRVITHMIAGGVIANCTQSMYRSGKDQLGNYYFFMRCDTEGCCDTYFTEADVREYLSDDVDEFECV
jgi:hypothetical protein